MSYTHLATTERVKTETYLELGMSIRSIERRFGRHPSTASREIKRNTGYESGRIQQHYEKAKTNCGGNMKIDDAMRRTFGHRELDTVVSGREKSKATTDRGKEFSGHERIQASLGVPVYFADPYSSWQRGSNENAKINGRPRKCLNWKTAHEVFTE